MTDLHYNISDIVFTLSNHRDRIIIHAKSQTTTYEREFASNSYINFHELEKSFQDKNFKITSMAKDTLKIQVGLLNLELKQSSKAVSNEFHETITTLANNIETQMEKNIRHETTIKELLDQVNHLNSKFSDMAIKILQLTQRVLQADSLKAQLNELKNELFQSRIRQEELENELAQQKINFQSRLKQLESKSISMTEIPTTKTIDELDIFDLIRKVTDEQQKIFEEEKSLEKIDGPEEEKQEISASLLSAFQILTLVPKIAWKDFNHSKIIETQAERETIKRFFDKNIVSMQILYRASENYFSVRKFHQKCDRIANTLVLCKTSSSNKKIGGYTPLKWQNPQDVKQKGDESEQSFIFSLTNEDKFDLRRKDCAIVNKMHWGPVFGCDLVINDKANLHANCYAKINMCYHNKKYKKDDEMSTEKFCGGKSSNHFRLDEWEVWHIELA